jgi:hypothetical protein
MAILMVATLTPGPRTKPATVGLPGRRWRRPGHAGGGFAPYDQPVEVIGLLLTVVSTIAGVVSAYYALVAYRRDQAKSRRDAPAPSGPGRTAPTPRRPPRDAPGSRQPKFVALLACAAAVLAVGVFLLVRHDDPSTSGAWTRQWGPGDLRFSESSGVDLDSVPPGPTRLANYTVVLEGQYYEDSYGIVPWTGNHTGSPSPALCNSLLKTLGGDEVAAVVHHSYCAGTGAGSIAIIVVKYIDRQAGDETGTLTRTTVWSAAGKSR